MPSTKRVSLFPYQSVLNLSLLLLYHFFKGLEFKLVEIEINNESGHPCLAPNPEGKATVF